MKKHKLIALCNVWENQAKKRFQDAEHEENRHAKEKIEHGAIIHFNHAQELRRSLNAKFGFNFILNVFGKYAKRP